jgi:hypothetical protein
MNDPPHFPTQADDAGERDKVVRDTPQNLGHRWHNPAIPI